MALDFGKLNFSVSFNPTSAFPLDARSYFETLTAAQAAAATAQPAGDSTTTYYYGQTLVVVEDSVAKMYIIQPDKTLKEAGGSISFNENVFTTGSNGKLDLYGFAEAVAGAQLLKGADGKLQWVKPDATTVEGLQTAVEALQQTVGDAEEGTGLVGDIQDLQIDLSALKTAVGQPSQEEPVQSATGIYKEIEDLETVVNSKADANNVYTKVQTDEKITTAVAQAAHLKRTIVEQLPEAAEADENTIYMVKKTGPLAQNTYDEYMVIEGAWEKIGDSTVDLTNYVTDTELNEALADKVDKVAGSRLMTETEGSKLAAIEANAQVNYVKSVTAEFEVSGEGQLSAKAIDKSKITGLSEALNGKVDKVDGSRLITTEEGNKLAAIELDENNQITLDTSNIEGLDSALNNKVDKVSGKQLSTNDYTNEEKTKLTGIEDGAQKNILESVKVNGSALPISEKAVDIPLATAEVLGLVKGSAEENYINVNIDGTLEVNSLNVNKLVQTSGDTLILNGGNAANITAGGQ